MATGSIASAPSRGNVQPGRTRRSGQKVQAPIIRCAVRWGTRASLRRLRENRLAGRRVKLSRLQALGMSMPDPWIANERNGKQHAAPASADLGLNASAQVFRCRPLRRAIPIPKRTAIRYKCLWPPPLPPRHPGLDAAAAKTLRTEEAVSRAPASAASIHCAVALQIEQLVIGP